MSMLEQTAVFLVAAVLAVPVFKRLGLGSVLGYLAAGVVIGPSGLALVGDVDSILHFAELGVVLLLFVIGLELQPTRLWVMRRPILATGGAQVVVTGAILALGAHLLGLSWQAAIVAGLALSLSSTAFALQILAERNVLTTRHGRSAFAILLFQDLAAIPLLAVVPLLGAAAAGSGEATWLSAAKVIGALAAVVVGGHYALRPIFRAVAATRIREVFTAMALLTVIGTALIVERAGLSMALGAFLAGVLLAESEFRHALEADIDPFKGLLLGLFFIAVGMSANLGLVADRPEALAGLVGGLVLVKFVVLLALGRWAGHDGRSARTLAIALSQGGEFAFVLFGFAVGAGVLSRATSDILILAVILSMATTPLLLLLDDAVRRLARRGAAEPDYEIPEDEENQVIIAGFGRVGQMIGRILRARRIGFTSLEASARQVDFVKRFGNKVYYGDASRPDLLRAAGAEKAVSFVLAIEDVDASVRAAETVRRHFPHLTIYARARNRHHAYLLMALGVQVIERETFHSSLEMARALLRGLGMPDYAADRTVATFREHDERRLHAHFDVRDDEARMAALAREWAQELEELFEQDEADEALG